MEYFKITKTHTYTYWGAKSFFLSTESATPCPCHISAILNLKSMTHDYDTNIQYTEMLEKIKGAIRLTLLTEADVSPEGQTKKHRQSKNLYKKNQ